MTINVPLENATENYTDKADTEDDDDTDVESKDVLNTLTGLLWLHGDTSPVPECDHCVIHFCSF